MTDRNLESVQHALKIELIEPTLKQIRAHLNCTHNEARRVRGIVVPKPQKKRCMCGDLYATDTEHCSQCMRSAARRKIYQEDRHVWDLFLNRPAPDYSDLIQNVEHY